MKENAWKEIAETLNIPSAIMMMLVKLFTNKFYLQEKFVKKVGKI